MLHYILIDLFDNGPNACPDRKICKRFHHAAPVGEEGILADRYIFH